jgi:hypothetical protein
LAAAAGVEAQLRSGLLDERRNVLDQASYLQLRLGGPEKLQQAVTTIIRDSGQNYSLTHGLLASLPAREAITTNYDRLFEAAWASAAAEPSSGAAQVRVVEDTSIIPRPIQPNARRWLLKLHGCVTRPTDIVLTRESYIRYHNQYAALEGILQATLLTRHLLFVGFSLRDDNFIRILDAVRRVVVPQPTDAVARRPFGSALMMGKDDVMENLYRDDLGWIALSEGEELAMKGADFRSPGRKLELFLDYLLARTGAASHVLDDDFTSILSAEEKRLREALRPLVEFARNNKATTPALARVKAFLTELGMT